MTRAKAFVDRLAKNLPVAARTVLVTAHPDDETVGFGGSLGLCHDATVVQLTDGAHPEAMQWARAQVTSAAAYRDIRRAERDAAWRASGWTVPIVDCEIPDQQVHQHLPQLLDRLLSLLATATFVWTHPYEGGHPDHDAAAYLVQTACDRLQAQGQAAPERMEFASYHWDGSARIVGRFWRNRSVREWCIPITGRRLEQKRAALAAYRSQARIVRRFKAEEEWYRLAPRYDFTQAPAPPLCMYDRKRWPTSNADLRAAMARAA